MDWDALWLSLRLGGLTVLVLIPLATALGRWLAVHAPRELFICSLNFGAILQKGMARS